MYLVVIDPVSGQGEEEDTSVAGNAFGEAGVQSWYIAQVQLSHSHIDFHIGQDYRG